MSTWSRLDTELWPKTWDMLSVQHKLWQCVSGAWNWGYKTNDNKSTRKNDFNEFVMYKISMYQIICNVYHTRPYGPLVSSTVQRWPKVKNKNLQGSKHLTTVWTRWHQGTIGLSHWVIVMSEVVSRGLRVVLRAPSAISRQPWIWCLDSFRGFVTPFLRTLNEVHTLATLTAHFVAV